MLRQITRLAVLAFLVLLAALIARAAQAAAKGDAKAGLEIFKKQCLRCHGEHGKGDGPAAKLLKTKPADWTDKARMSKLTENDLFTVISKGGVAV